jgi:hypothetical protein
MTNQPKETKLVANPFGSAVENQNSAFTSIEAQKGFAEVQFSMMMARKFPRDEIACIDKIINACTRQGMAESAVYSYSKGGTEITGPTIRLAEMIAQNWDHLHFGWTMIAGNGQTEVIAYAWDLQTGVRIPLSFTVKHWRDTRSGGYMLKDEREIYELCANQAARRLRKCILTLIPVDVVDAALDQCDLTLKAHVEITKDTIKTMLDRFLEFGVSKEMIEKRIQRRIDTIQPAQFIGLRKIYNSIKDGMSKANDWFDIPEKEAPLPEPEKTTTLDSIKAEEADSKKKDNQENAESAAGEA